MILCLEQNIYCVQESFNRIERGSCVENRMFISGSVSGSEKDIRDTEDWEIENFTSIPNPELSLRYNEFISPMICNYFVSDILPTQCNT